jgi:hypothetical protein
MQSKLSKYSKEQLQEVFDAQFEFVKKIVSSADFKTIGIPRLGKFTPNRRLINNHIESKILKFKEENDEV